MKRAFLTTLILLAVLGFSVAVYAFVWQVRNQRHTIDVLEDDKAALQIAWQREQEESARLQQQNARLRQQTETLKGDKASLGRSLVTLMDRVAQLQIEAKRTKSTLDASAIDQAARAIVAAKEKADAEKAEQARQAAEKAAKVDADRKRIASEQGPLRVEDLKPLDAKAPVKSDQDALNELLELAAPR